MFDLYSFYRSKEWEDFRKLVINERMTEDGYILDEVTGKPITQKYDVILHHKEELTEENVNDVMVSLNPDNIMIVSHRTHNKIHDKFGHKHKEIFLVYGPPLAGKHEWVESNLTDGELIINIDDIWMAVSGQPRYVKPPRLNAVVFQLHRQLMDAARIRLGKWDVCYIVGAYPLMSERERICKDYGAREIRIDTSKEECLTRAKELGLDEYEKYIIEWFRRDIHIDGRGA